MNDAFPTLGILGGGQLGKMTAMAAIRMGLHVRLLSPKEAGPMQQVGTALVDDWTDPEVLRRFAEACDVVTVESEWAPADRLEPVLPAGTELWPKPSTVNAIRHKGTQKTLLEKAGLPVPAFQRCTSIEEARSAAEELGYPVVLKQYRGSYDGYGNATVEAPEGIATAWEELASEEGLLVEAFVPFERELAILVARAPKGDHAVYPLVHTEQVDHRCHTVNAPAEVSSTVEEEARRVALGAVEAVNGVGITAVELFELADGRVLINELAPRPHNTGHYTIEACHTSQFENHVRAVFGWPLGDPSLAVPAAAMTNVLGQREATARPEGLTDALEVPGTAVHIYGKSEVRANRKMGHVTVTGSDAASVRMRAQKAASLIRL